MISAHGWLTPNALADLIAGERELRNSWADSRILARNGMRSLS